MARQLLRSEDDAEEAVQEAMSRAWRGWANCRSRDQPLPWLLSITRNEAFRIMQRRERREELLLPNLAEHSASEPTFSDDVEISVSVRVALGQISRRDRLLLHLRYEQDMTQPRIAEILGIPEGTVKVQLHRARKRLAETLGDGEG